MRKNAWQDGVGGSNCPIQPGSSWTYHFKVKDQIGSYYYYPSLMFQKAGGGFGSIRVNPRHTIASPFAPPAADFAVLIGDWYTTDHQVINWLCCLKLNHVVRTHIFLLFLYDHSNWARSWYAVAWFVCKKTHDCVVIPRFSNSWKINAFFIDTMVQICLGLPRNALVVELAMETLILSSISFKSHYFALKFQVSLSFVLVTHYM